MSDESAPDAPSSDGSTADPSTRRGLRKGKAKKRHTVGTVITAALIALALVTSLGMIYFYRHLNDNLDYNDISQQLSDRPEKKETGPVNILVMGSDSRAGDNNIDNLTGDGERSDTTILFHLSADRKDAYGISIPRDTLVDRPDCKTKGGEKIPGASGVLWNEAFSVGGPACTFQQFEQITGIRVDNYVVLDFSGFKDMVDAIDGVKVCIPEDISDPEHGIDIPAGTREIKGKEALNYVRARYTLGDGSDIGRIKRQQAFIAAMAAKVVSSGTLTRLDRVLGFLDAATKSLETDFKSVTAIGKVGVSFRSIGLDNIKFVTVPNAAAPSDPNRLVMLPEAKSLWKRVINDEPLGKRVLDGVITAGDDVDGKGNKGNTGSGSASPSDGPSTGNGSGNGSGESAEERAAEREAAGLCA